MIHRFLLLTVMLLTLFCEIRAGNTLTNTEGKYPYEYVEGDPLAARIYTLENGLKVYLTVNREEPRIQTYIAVKAGSKNDPKETTGLAHYLEHMLFKGTDKYGTKNWEKEKVLLNKIAQLYEIHKNAESNDMRLKLYKEIDRVSYEASKFAIPKHNLSNFSRIIVLASIKFFINCFELGMK